MGDNEVCRGHGGFESRPALYVWLAQQVEALVEGLNPRLTPQARLTHALANVAALCFYELNGFVDADAALQATPVNWFGFYLVQSPGLLVLGPFQGRPACTEIVFGRGVCGKAADMAQTLVVPDVHAFPGHVACDAASKAEVVVPIFARDGGGVVGVMDVDSTRAGFFDEEDGRGLEAIAAVLTAHLTFDLPRAIASPRASLASCVSGIAHVRIEAMAPETTTHHLGGWAITLTRLNRVASQADLQVLERNIGIAAFPEMLFPLNSLTLRSDDAAAAPRLTFDAAAVLRAAAAFYHTAHYREVVCPRLRIPLSDAWATSPFTRHDAGVDWAWRHCYYGIADEHLLKPLQSGMPGINWDLLRDRSLPIVAFDEFDLFEDDLHDAGLVRCSLKFRVMDAAFFVLLRHVVRIDRHAMWLRDVRIFHEFATKRDPESGMPHIVFEEKTAVYYIDPAEEKNAAAAALNTMTPEAMLEKATTVHTEVFYMDALEDDDVIATES